MKHSPDVAHESTKEDMKSRPRAKWGSITRNDIVDAAMRMVLEGRYGELTIRSLASELGVATMSIYGHVKDRDDILDEIADRLLAKRWRPRCSESDWKRWIAEGSNRLRQLLVTQPAALHVFLKHPVDSPAALIRMNAMVRVLSNNGCNESEAVRAYAALHTYTLGFAALEASRASWQSNNETSGETLQQLASFTTTRQFKIGLDFIIEGIERQNEQ